MAMHIDVKNILDQYQKIAKKEIRTNKKKKNFKRTLTDDNLCPFQLQRSFGINPKAPVLNLSTERRTLLAFACSHVIMFYDYITRKMLPLLGHRNFVRTLSITRDGKWLLTADFEDDYVIIIWNIEKRIPVYTLFHPHGSEGMTAARISPDAKQIVTVGNEKCQKVYFWLWTYGKDTPDASVSLIDTTSERVKEIVFNDKHPEQFALTTDYHVLFLTWKGHELSYDQPKVMAKIQRIGIFNGSCYASKAQRVFTATTNGYILVWTDVSRENKHAVNDLNDEKKKHIKSVKLQACSINVITTNKNILVTGNSNGRITFYDYQLKLLYWFENYNLDSIRWISFSITSNLVTNIFADAFAEKYNNENKKNVENSKKMWEIQNLTPLNISKEFLLRNQENKFINKMDVLLPTDVALQDCPSNLPRFLACTPEGIIALIEISRRKCYFAFSYPAVIATSIDIHPESNYVVIGDAQSNMYLHDYEKVILITFKSIPPLPNFQPILEKEAINENIVYITCPHSHESLKAITALKFSPTCDILVCGLENGAIWMLHPITLEILDEIPYKHSSVAINKIAFTKFAQYMAYMDNAPTVVVFKRNDAISSTESNLWNLLGKYHSHYLPIRDILFSLVASDDETPRFFSLGEDQELVEYDLLHSGPYPIPGLKILSGHRIEKSAVPLCFAWYPQSKTETFLMIANSEYKYKIFNDAMAIRGTYLGPTFGEPVQQLQMLTNKFVNDKKYMVFATDQEIGLQLLPFDGNPYKIVGMTGHPEKITSICVSNNGQIAFTMGYNDPCVLMWKIQYSTVDTMAQLGGKGLLPFYQLIEGGKDGWLMNEMKEMFYYAQILHQGENTIATRIVSDTIVAGQIPNVMRAIGYFPTNEEIENFMAELYYKHHVETGKLIEKVKFEEFVRLYVNHRPAFKTCMREIKEVFRAFVKDNFTNIENPTLTREEFMDILFGEAILGTLKEDYKILGEPLTLQEAYTYLKLLVPFDEKIFDYPPSLEQKSVSFDFRFVPTRISYKDFIMDIMGIELPEKTRTDNRKNQDDN